ncbi:NYN domain-containing protein [Nocardioides sp. Y6]|uniref:NYN domain-containing protein n=1 Tax=Nocardioides malaquae TaxID=2773426 RepID=A0ABR9RTH8_9ACTN|nr:NYN domain-containing protein [Nocardioides malaquae]MBE7324907.1 NYN domain-containing protein [Nocardioides malaquae]
MAANDARLAVLIDADNAQASRIDALMAEVATLGTATVRRIYGDFTTPQLGGWKAAANQHAIQPMQQFAYTKGKNATDSALIIDAMDLLYSDRLDGFVLVSSDSDFTRLAARLRESGMTVYGVGERKTPEAFRAACDRFIYTDVMGVASADAEAEADPDAAPEVDEPNRPTPRQSSKQLRSDSALVQLLRGAIASASDDDGWANLGLVGSTAAKQSPDFDSRNWGYAKLIDLVSAIGLFEVRRPDGGNGGGAVEIRQKTKG